MTDEAMKEMSARRGSTWADRVPIRPRHHHRRLLGRVRLARARISSPFNLFSVGRALAVDIVIGFAQMAALATGGMNLSVGSIGVCAVMTGGYLMQTLALPVPVAISARSGSARRSAGSMASS